MRRQSAEAILDLQPAPSATGDPNLNIPEQNRHRILNPRSAVITITKLIQPHSFSSTSPYTTVPPILSTPLITTPLIPTTTPVSKLTRSRPPLPHKRLRSPPHDRTISSATTTTTTTTLTRKTTPRPPTPPTHRLAAMPERREEGEEEQGERGGGDEGGEEDVAVGVAAEQSSWP
ncbi:hypothetical protein VTJ49DRAFT_5235 [Mycothermus thermophilus]|uniref:Uncharacterized protein n=1 Tax=Humicola insolens TaxID=85995 RepID=A0ABR3V4P2_HUMIN